MEAAGAAEGEERHVAQQAEQKKAACLRVLLQLREEVRRRVEQCSLVGRIGGTRAETGAQRGAAHGGDEEELAQTRDHQLLPGVGNRALFLHDHAAGAALGRQATCFACQEGVFGLFGWIVGVVLIVAILVIAVILTIGIILIGTLRIHR